jgi:hypothetical protein
MTPHCDLPAGSQLPVPDFKLAVVFGVVVLLLISAGGKFIHMLLTRGH